MSLSTDYSFFRGDKPRIIGHRGAAGEAPENTLASFQRAFDDGAAYVELDVRLTKDEEVVILHDSSVDRTTDGRGLVSDLSLQDLKALDAGYGFTHDRGASYAYRGHNLRIPTLEEFFTTFPDAKTIIELKPAPSILIGHVVEIVRRFGKEQDVLLATEDDAIMLGLRQAIRDQNPPVATGFSYGEVAAFMRWMGGSAADFAAAGQAFQIPCEYGGLTLVSDESVQASHGLGLEVFVWTINDPTEMKRLLDLGVDGIITDYPARARSVLPAFRR